MAEINANLQPAHMGYPGIWELAKGPKPELLAEYLGWVTASAERLDSAVNHTQYYPPGFHGLLIAIHKPKDAETHTASLQLNFYDPRFPGDEEPHGHSRDAFSTWYAPKGTRQILTRYHVIPDEAPRFRGLPVEERVTMAMNIGDRGDGGRPIYMPTVLGRNLILPRSETKVAPLGSQRFDSTEVHHASFEGDGVAVSVHYKGPEENPGLNTRDGFTYYKSLSREAAEKLVRARAQLSASLQSDESDRVRLAPSTTLFPLPENVEVITTRGKIPPPEGDVCLGLIDGALKTVVELNRAA